MASVASGESPQQPGSNTGSNPGFSNISAPMDVENSPNNRNSGGNPTPNSSPRSSEGKGVPAAGHPSRDGGNTNSRSTNSDNNRSSTGKNDEGNKESGNSSSSFTKRLNEIMGDSKSSGAGENNSMEEEKNATEMLREYQQRLQELEELNQKLESEKSTKEKEKSEINQELEKYRKAEQEKNVNELVGSFKKVLESIKAVEPTNEEEVKKKQYLESQTEQLVNKYKKLYKENNGKINKEELDSELSLLMFSSNALQELTNQNKNRIREDYRRQNFEFKRALENANRRRPKSYPSDNIPTEESGDSKEEMHTASARRVGNESNNNSSEFDLFERVYGKKRGRQEERTTNERETEYIPSKLEIVMSCENDAQLSQKLEMRKQQKMSMTGKRPKGSSNGTHFASIHVASAASSIKGFSTDGMKMSSFDHKDKNIVPPRLRGYGPHNTLPKNDPMMEAFRKFRDTQTTEFVTVPMFENAREMNEGIHVNDHNNYFAGIEEMMRKVMATKGSSHHHAYY